MADPSSRSWRYTYQEALPAAVQRHHDYVHGFHHERAHGLVDAFAYAVALGHALGGEHPRADAYTVSGAEGYPDAHAVAYAYGLAGAHAHHETRMLTKE